MKLLKILFSIIFIASLSCTTIKRLPDYGFEPIFDGKTLTGWDGDKRYWRVENGAIAGEITPETILKQNSFLIYNVSNPGDFELKVDYRISSKGNSGINYRSSRLDSIPFAMKGYQADIDGKDRYKLGYPRGTGQNYEERGRQFLAARGQRTVIETGKSARFIDSTGSRHNLLKAIHYDDWNQLHIIAKGNIMKHYINKVLMSEVTDNDSVNRKLTGLIGLQLHAGAPMKIEFKNFLLKSIPKM
ncbi:MAG: DUF1080 domain-containing protein [Pyrinomonadaceae bacterium]|nr:DUF1080 domain-containing protein [Sphingobacteriaceae bacterium]